MAYSALHMKVPTRRDQRVTLRPGNRRDLMRSARTRVMHRSRVSQCQETTGCSLSIWCRGFVSGVVEESGVGFGREPDVVPLDPACCMRRAAHFSHTTAFSLVLCPARSTHTKHTRVCCSRSTHSLVSGNLNAGVSYTGKTPVLQKKWRGRNRRRKTGQELGLVHASPYHAHQNISFK